MRVTFLGHSGFLVELSSVTLLFDWWKGALPALPEGKPLLICASHWHEDHFSPHIFSLPAAAFLLGSMDALWLSKKGASPEVLQRCICLNGNETCSPLPGVTVETLPSTDEGVAFIVSVDGKVIFHAGDLNWWHWEGEDPAWNRQMELDFKAYAQPLSGRHIHLAMLPIDPRQEADGFRGAAYILSHGDVHRCLPMHQWEQFSFTQQFLDACPEFAAQITPVTRLGQTFTF